MCLLPSVLQLGRGWPDLVIRARVCSHETGVKSSLGPAIQKSEAGDIQEIRTMSYELGSVAGDKLEVRNHNSDARSQASSDC